MNRAARAVPAKLGKVERFGHDTLAGKRRVAVHEDRQDGEVERAVRGAVLFCAHDPLENGVDGFEMARVSGEIHLRAVAIPRRERALGAEVVFDVARTEFIGILRAFELLEDLRVAFAREICEDVETPAVGHADAHFVHAGARRARHDGVEERDHRFAALEREAPLAHVLRLKELLEGLGGVEAIHDVRELLLRERLAGALNLSLEPESFFRIGEVHVLDSGCARVGIAKLLDNVAKGRPLGSAEAARGECAVEVPEREAVGGDVEVGVFPLAILERVDVGDEMPARTVRVDEIHDVREFLLVGIFERVVGNPLDRFVRHAHRGENPLVEAVEAHELVRHDLEELAGGCPLNHAVVVGRGQRHDL